MSKEGKSVAFFGSIDYDMLRAQKYDLSILIASRREHYEEDDAVNESLLGILHLIDAVQAHACDALSMGEVAVFAVDEEGEDTGARDCGHAQSASLRGEPCRACALQVEEG